MRADFYHLTRDPAERVVPGLARNTLRAGERLLVVSERPGQLQAISEALWSVGSEFLANGLAGQGHEAAQPILLSAAMDPVNGARFVVLADGIWREGAEPFARSFLLFDEATVQAARECWAMLGKREGLERHYWKQERGRWVEAT